MAEQIHPVNEKYLPELRFDDFPIPHGKSAVTDIAHRYWRCALQGRTTITTARKLLNQYADGRIMLAAFDRRLVAYLIDCGDRDADLRFDPADEA